MNADIALLQAYWLFSLPVPWLWLYWRRRYPSAWPRILPMLAMRYPLLHDLSFEKNSERAKIKKMQADRNMAIAMSFMILALAQPVRYSHFFGQEKNSEAVDLILVVDTALSMTLSDYEIEGEALSRIDLARLLLKKFVNNYSGTRMGLVTLGNPPSLWLPLTGDKAVIEDAVNRIRTFLGGRISDMGASLQLVREQFKDQQEKVVVIVSDGGTQIGSVSPENAAQELADNGFSVYVIAVGSSDPEAESLGNSSLIYEAANLNMLQKVAEKGQGLLFHALDAQGFSEALLTIEKRHRKPIKKEQALRLSEPWYPLPLGIAMVLLLYTAFFKGDEGV